MIQPDCALCDHKVCRDGIDCYDNAEHMLHLYDEAEHDSINFMHAAAEVEAEGYMRWPRSLEIINFAKKAGLSHLGVAFCIGLSEEARTYVEILKKEFTVSSVCCKICGVPKNRFGLPYVDENSSFEVMCSPLGQADLLNRSDTELNILMGLCVGHDVLFTRFSEAPVTTLIAKDRVLGHNPAAALYVQYWRSRIG